MPRKTYDFPDADEPAIVKFMKEESNEIAMQRQHENREPEKVLKAIKCSDSKCNFYFDLGTDDNKIAAGTNHTAKTGHSVLMEYE